jgi:hypothetical protein
LKRSALIYEALRAGFDASRKVPESIRIR